MITKKDIEGFFEHYSQNMMLDDLVCLGPKDRINVVAKLIDFVKYKEEHSSNEDQSKPCKNYKFMQLIKADREIRKWAFETALKGKYKTDVFDRAEQLISYVETGKTPSDQ